MASLVSSLGSVQGQLASVVADQQQANAALLRQSMIVAAKLEAAQNRSRGGAALQGRDLWNLFDKDCKLN